MGEMRKSPEEIKKGLHCCLNDIPCEECPYDGQERCLRNALIDLRAYILTLEADKTKLQAQNAELVKQVEQLKADKKKIMEIANILSDAVTRLERERDAAVKDLKKMSSDRGGARCAVCRYRKAGSLGPCERCIISDSWEWRGVPEQEEEHEVDCD